MNYEWVTSYVLRVTSIYSRAERLVRHASGNLWFPSENFYLRSLPPICLYASVKPVALRQWRGQAQAQ